MYYLQMDAKCTRRLFNSVANRSMDTMASETSRTLAQRNLDLFDVEGLDAIITNAAGCGSHLKTYGRLLAEDKRYAERAPFWSRNGKDISEFLVQIVFRAPTAAPANLPV